MNILVLAPYIPYPLNYGGAIRTYHLLRQLSRQHAVHLLAFRDEVYPTDPSGVEPYCRTVTSVPRRLGNKRAQQLRSLVSTRSFQWRSHCTPAMQEALDRLVREQHLDLILVEFSQMAGFRFPAGPAVVLDEHNIEFEVLERMAHAGGPLRRAYNRLEAFKFRREELAAARRATLTLVTSERDGELLRRHAPHVRCTVITNGVDCDRFAPPAQPRQPDLAVFVGATHYFPNEQGILFFLREIHGRICAARPNFRLVVVGGNPPPSLTAWNSPQVKIIGPVEDVRPYLWESAVCVVPLRLGGGTRFKILEALAAGVPVVSTRLGAEGIPVTDGQEVLLGDAPEEFAQAVVRVLTEPELAASLVREGLALVRQHFDWSVIGNRLDQVLTAAAGSRAGSGPRGP